MIKEYVVNLASTTVLQSIVDLFYMVLSVLEKNKFKYNPNLNIAVDDTTKFVQEIKNRLLEGAHRPLVQQIDFFFSKTDPLNPEEPPTKVVKSFRTLFMFSLNPYTISLNGFSVSMTILQTPSDHEQVVPSAVFSDNFYSEHQSPKFPYTVKYSGDLTNPFLVNRYVCRAVKASLTNLIKILIYSIGNEKVSADQKENTKKKNRQGTLISSFDRLFCPESESPIKYFNPEKDDTVYDFNCPEFRNFLRDFSEGLESESPQISDLFFGSESAEWKAKLTEMINIFDFKCLEKGPERDPAGDSSFGYMITPGKKKHLFMRFLNHYLIEPDENSPSRKKAKMALKLASLMNGKAFPPEYFGVTPLNKENKRLYSPDGDFNSMCYTGELSLTQDTQSFIECFKFIPFGENDDFQELMQWKYRRVLIYYVKSMTTVHLASLYKYTPKYVFDELISAAKTELGGRGPLPAITVLGAAPKQSQEEMTALLVYLTLKGFESAPIRLEIYESNNYYLKLLMRTSHQEFEILIDKYPLASLIHHVNKRGKAEGFAHRPANKELDAAIANFPASTEFSSLDKYYRGLRGLKLRSQYLVKVVAFLANLVEWEKSTLFDIDLTELAKTAIDAPCLRAYQKTDLVGYPVLAGALEFALSKLTLKVPLEGGSGEDEGTFVKLTDVFDKKPELLHGFMSPTVFRAQPGSDEEKEQRALVKAAKGEPVTSESVCKLVKMLEERYSADFSSNYAALYQEPKSKTEFLLKAHSYESDDLFVFHWMFKCQYFQQEWAIAYSALDDIYPSMVAHLKEKLRHLEKALVAEKSANKGGASKMKFNEFSQLFVEALDESFATQFPEGAAVQNCAKLAEKSGVANFDLQKFAAAHQIKENTVVKRAFCVAHTPVGKANQFAKEFKGIWPVAIVVEDPSTSPASILVRMPVRSVRNIFRKVDPGQSDVEYVHSDYRFPMRPIKKNDAFTKLFCDEVAERLRANLPK